MHYAGKNLHIVYIHPTHEKLKTHFGFSLAQFIKKLQADTVSWRSSVSEVVWKGAPAPAFLRLYTTHTRNTHPLPVDGNLYCVCTVSPTTRICKTTGDQ